MLEGLVVLPIIFKEEEQRSFVCLLIQNTSTSLVQPVQLSILPYMELNIKLSMVHTTIYSTKMSPVLSAMLPPELQ